MVISAVRVLEVLHLTYCVVAVVVKPTTVQKLENYFCKIVIEKVTQHPWTLRIFKKGLGQREEAESMPLQTGISILSL